MVDLTLPDVATAPARDAADEGRRLATRVLAWQHRHPLARRVDTGDVGGHGVIALPYGADGTPLFHQPSLLPGLSHRALVEFAARHAAGQRPGPAEWPQRDIERADAASEPAPHTRYLLTATLPDPRSTTPRRLLLAPVDTAGKGVWGRRPLDRVRLAAAGALVLAVLLLAGWGLGQALKQRAATPTPAPASGASSSPPAASAASAPVPTAAASVAPASAPATAARTTAASAPALASAPSTRPSAPPASAPAPTVAAAPAAPASVPPPVLLPMPSRPAAAASPGAPPSPQAAPAAPAGPHFALVSAPSKQRADAEATLQRVRRLLGPAIGTLQIQVMPSPQGFVVTLWPLTTQADAERLAEVLARRGVAMKWLEF